MGIDVAIIGLGRVGLPLALSFADAGLRVLGIDRDADKLAAIRAGRMPFDETGTQALLDRVARPARSSARTSSRTQRRRTTS